MKKLLLIISIVILASLTACKTSSGIVVGSHSESLTDSLKTAKYEVIKDSVDIHDSTVYIFKDSVNYVYRYRTEKYYNKSAKADTVCIYMDRVITDSIPKIVTVTKYKEVNKLKWYQDALIWVGIIALVMLFVVIISKFIAKK